MEPGWETPLRMSAHAGTKGEEGKGEGGAEGSEIERATLLDMGRESEPH